MTCKLDNALIKNDSEDTTMTTLTLNTLNIAELTTSNNLDSKALKTI